MRAKKNWFYKLSLAAVVFGLVAISSVSMSGQTVSPQGAGVPEDWSHHHVVFSNPGTFTEAQAHGRFEQWYRTVADPRYNMQRMKRTGVSPDAVVSPGGPSTPTGPSPNPIGGPIGGRPIGGPIGRPIGRPPGRPFSPPPVESTLQRDWSASLGGAGVAPGMYPAKYSFTTSTPSCSDYVVYGVDVAGGSGSQANIVGLTNLYNGTCSPAPSVMFSYYVGGGIVQTSPVLGPSVDQVVYVESISGGSKFHVLTIGTGGNGGCPSNPCNGASATSPVLPATTYLNGSPTTNNALNNAVDYAITLNGNVSDTYSSPFYDYFNDIAYVGDDGGKLHKFHPVFGGTPAEVVSSGTNVWPAAVGSGKLSSPVYDVTSGKVWVGDASGFLYSVSPTIGSGTGGVVKSAAVGSGGTGIVDAPIVDSSAQTVYVFTGDNGSNSAIAQFTFSTFTGTPSPRATASVGTLSTTIPLYAGSFDNIYYGDSTPGNGGNLYVCGNPGGNPTLYKVAISTSSPYLTPTAGVVLASSNVRCSPVTEFYNTSGTAVDWLFAAVPANSCGAGTGLGGCVMSFNITSAAPTIGPWTPSTSYAWDAEVVDTSGRIQQCTGGNTNGTHPTGGCGIAGSMSGTTTPSWTATTTPNDGGLAPNSNIIQTGGKAISISNATITLYNSTAGSITFTCTANGGGACGNLSLTSPPGGGATPGSIANSGSGNGSPAYTPSYLTIGPIQYTFENTFTSSATLTAPQIDSNCTSCHNGTAQNIFAPITGNPVNCTFADANGSKVCYSPFPLTWTYVSASNGQTTAPEPAGAGGMIIDNVGTAGGVANIYLGTLSGTGTTNSAVKFSQAGLQ
jgi:hypothetical protein